MIRTEDDYIEWATWLIKKNYPVPTKDIYKMAKILEMKYNKTKEKNVNLQSISIGAKESSSNTP